MAKQKNFNFDTTYAICLLPVILFAFYWVTRPFSDLLSENVCRVAPLSSPQKTNIKLACHKINNVMVKPNESFSFNRIVGPRTIERGFLEAPTYENGKTIMTEGGGVCLLSSLVYKTALEAGMQVNERQPHSRLVRSVKPGFDATVLYGRYDLSFTNNTDKPVIIKSSCDASSCSVSIMGTKVKPDVKLVSTKVFESKDHILVSVYKKWDNSVTLITRDKYKK